MYCNKCMNDVYYPRRKERPKLAASPRYLSPLDEPNTEVNWLLLGSLYRRNSLLIVDYSRAP